MLKTEKVKCQKCGTSTEIAVGHLTEEGKKNYLCDICRERVLENRVSEINNRSDGKKLLID